MSIMITGTDTQSWGRGKPDHTDPDRWCYAESTLREKGGEHSWPYILERLLSLRPILDDHYERIHCPDHKDRFLLEPVPLDHTRWLGGETPTTAIDDLWSPKP